MKERILILGGAGLIGSKVCQKLIEKNHDVAILDNFMQYTDPLKFNYGEVLSYRKRLMKGAKIYRGDASISFDLSKVLNDFKPDRIIHLVALTRADINDDNITNAVNKSIVPILNIIEHYREDNNLKRFLYTSSSYVYGNFEYSPCDEEHPKEPTSTYGGVKYACEVLTKAWCKRFDIPYTIIRPIAAYGPSDLNGKLSMQNIKKALESHELPILNSLDELSDYTYIDDLADGMILALFSPEAVGEEFNLSSGTGVTVLELIQKFNDLNYRVEPVIAEKLKSRPKRGYLSIDKAKRILGYNPKTSLAEGLASCIEYIENNEIVIGD